MLNRLIALLRGELQAEAHEAGPFERRQIAVACLLLEAMYVDHRASADEHAAVTRLLQGYFSLPAELATQLTAVAELRYAEALDDWEFVEAVRAGFDDGERAEVLALLWEVAYADGDLANLESHLLDRLAAQLELEQHAIEAARAAAVTRAGLLGGDN